MDNFAPFTVLTCRAKWPSACESSQGRKFFTQTCLNPSPEWLQALPESRSHNFVAVNQNNGEYCTERHVSRNSATS